MDVTCNVIEDLLPLYADGICSEDSKTIIEHHTAVCSGCREKLDAMTEKLEKNDESPKPENPFKKTRTHYVRLIAVTLCICVLIAVPTVVCGIFTANEASCHGVSWSTLKLESRMKETGRLIQKGEYREALDRMIIPNLEGYSDSEVSAFKDLYAEDMKNYFEKHPIEDIKVYEKYSTTYRLDGFLHIVMKNESAPDNSPPIFELAFSSVDMKLERCKFTYGIFNTISLGFSATEEAIKFYDDIEMYFGYYSGLPDLAIAPADLSERYFCDLNPDNVNKKDNLSYDLTFFSYECVVNNFHGDDLYFELKDKAIETTEKFTEEYLYLGCRIGKTEYIRDEVCVNIDRFALQHVTLSFLGSGELITVECDVPFSMNTYPFRLSAVRNIVYSENTPDDFKEQFENIFAY